MNRCLGIVSLESIPGSLKVKKNYGSGHFNVIVPEIYGAVTTGLDLHSSSAPSWDSSK
jgi:hypothetical protein